MGMISVKAMRAKFPEYAALDDDQLLHGIHNTFYPGVPIREFVQHVDYDTQREDLAKEATKGTGLMENFQAGVDTFLQGRDQLFGKLGLHAGSGNTEEQFKKLGYAPQEDVTDEDVQRKRGYDEALAKHTPGGGFAQGVGEVLPAMAIPAAGGDALAARLGGGFLARTAGTAAGGAGAGAVGGTLTPTAGNESRAANAVRGGAVGAVLPGALRAAAVPVRWAATPLTRMFSRTDAAERAARAVTQHIPDEDMPRVLAELDAAGGAGAMPGGRLPDIPTSAAQATANPFLVQAESATKARPGAGGADWTRQAADRNAALYHNIQDMAPSEHALNLRGQIRNVNTAPLREGAQAAAEAAGNYEAPILAHLTDLAGGDSAGNPAVRTLVRTVTESLGDSPTPGRVYSVRKWLAKQLDAPKAIGDDVASASVKEARREARGIMDAMDQALDAASGGQWNRYLTQYGHLSAPINEGRALRNVADDIERQPLLGRTPEVTFTKYRNALEKHGDGDFGSKLGPRASQETQAMLENMRVAEGGSRTRKIVATDGGGSMTDANQQLGELAGAVMQAVGAVPPGTRAAGNWIANLNREQVEREIVRMQSSPTNLAAAIRSLSPNQRQQLVSQIVSSANVGAGAQVANNHR
jgi:hypothetical protein